MSAPKTIAILSPGDMGSGVAEALTQHGFDIVTSLAGRSDRSRGLADAAGMRDCGELEDLVGEADLILSILPPAAALGQAAAVAQAMTRADARPSYADCNAISPATARRVGEVIETAGATFIDGGIIGAPPRKPPPTRFYVSGPDLDPILALDGAGIQVKPLGTEIGRASAIKMCYAGLTKGTFSLHTAVLVAAERLGLSDELRAEFEFSQSDALARMRALVPFLPADAGRWVGEMEEIAATFAAAGVTPGFHQGAADTLRLLADTPFAQETRETLDRGRTLEEAVKVYADYVAKARGVS